MTSKRRIAIIDQYGEHVAAVYFQGADLRGSNLRDASLVGANLRRANLGADNLGGTTSLQGTNLAEAVLEGANMLGARIDDRTVFPAGFDPNAMGMVADSES